MQDIEARQVLVRVLGRGAPPELVQSLHALGLLLGNYGHLHGTDTHHWLGRPIDGWSGPGIEVQGGVIPIHAQAEQGVALFCRAMVSTLRDALTSRDVSKLSWSLLEQKVLPVEPTQIYWNVVRQGLWVALRRVTAADGEMLWSWGSFTPASLRSTWTHASAFEDLRTKVHPSTPQTVLLGLLTWAAVVGDYGRVAGKATCNWGLVGKPGHAPQDGYVLDETGTYLIQKMDPDEGIQVYLSEVAAPNSKVFESEDIGLMAMTMLQNRAFGVNIVPTLEAWTGLCSEIRLAIDQIAEETGLVGEWRIRSLHPDKIREAEEKKKIFEETVTKQAESPLRKALPWVLGIGALVGGAFAWRHLTKPKDPSPEPITAKELLAKKNASPLEDAVSSEAP